MPSSPLMPWIAFCGIAMAAPSAPHDSPKTGVDERSHAATTGPGAPATAPTAYEALMLLQAGNERFASDRAEHPNSDRIRRADVASNGQKPFAVVLTCADSRVPAENIFDRGIGDLFVVRVAGNVCGVSEAATIEYGLQHLGAPLLVVMGHSGCGAVTAAASGGHVEGPLAELLALISPAVGTARRVYPDRSGTAIVPEAVRFNVWQSVTDLYKRSQTSASLAAAGKVKVVGAIYELDTGRVQWMGESPTQHVAVSGAIQTSPLVPSAVHRPVAAPSSADAAGSPHH